MAVLNRTTLILVLLAIINIALGQTSQGGPHTSQRRSHTIQGGSHESQGGSHESQGGPHEDQSRVKRQAEQGDNEDGGVVSWTTCDQTVTPKYSCQDCNTRLICLPVGGKLIACPSVYRPYCNNSRCSAVPSADCA